MLRLLSRPAARAVSTRPARLFQYSAISEAEGSRSATALQDSSSSSSSPPIIGSISPSNSAPSDQFETIKTSGSEKGTSSKAYRLARSRLWTPSLVEIESAGIDLNVKAAITAANDDEEVLDRLYESVWKGLTAEMRGEVSLRAWFQCVRRLGWRKGYTSGYPLSAVKNLQEKLAIETRSKFQKMLISTNDPAEKESLRAKIEEAEEETELLMKKRSSSLEKLASPAKSEVNEGIETMAEVEERLAWTAWKSMNLEEREAEAKMAWNNRDRSLIYIDDTNKVSHSTHPRWFQQPQPVGFMTFLPNVTIRLVRNNTRRNGEYDPYKATFRVPLSMHKHNLKSYLLAIYGLRTTWVRSTIYRASVVRSRIGFQLKSGHSSGTYKKVEVGLLEPFVFPEITSKFLQDQMMLNEFKISRQKTLSKMSGKRRWRTKSSMQRLISDTSGAAIDEDSIVVMERDDGQVGSQIEKSKLLELPSIFRKTGITTKRQSTILKLVHKKRLAKEAQVAAKMSELKQEHENRQSASE